MDEHEVEQMRVSLEVGGSTVTAWVDFTYHVENDGIGWYEYGSAREFDRGEDYVVIDAVDVWMEGAEVPYESLGEAARKQLDAMMEKAAWNDLERCRKAAEALEKEYVFLMNEGSKDRGIGPALDLIARMRKASPWVDSAMRSLARENAEIRYWLEGCRWKGEVSSFLSSHFPAGLLEEERAGRTDEELAEQVAAELGDRLADNAAEERMLTYLKNTGGWRVLSCIEDRLLFNQVYDVLRGAFKEGYVEARG